MIDPLALRQELQRRDHLTRQSAIGPSADDVPQMNHGALAPLVKLGAIRGPEFSDLVNLPGQARILYAMGRDGLLPPMAAPLERTDWRTILLPWPTPTTSLGLSISSVTPHMGTRSGSSPITANELSVVGSNLTSQGYP